MKNELIRWTWRWTKSSPPPSPPRRVLFYAFLCISGNKKTTEMCWISVVCIFWHLIPAEREGLLAPLVIACLGSSIKKPGTACLFFSFLRKPENKFSVFSKTKKPPFSGFFVCGERGIRTPGPLRVNGFQDRRNRPLCHLSGGKSTPFL